ncbi:hypothetical protein AB3N59_18210 [Leptospira sp. WS92.C1]
MKNRSYRLLRSKKQPFSIRAIDLADSFPFGTLLKIKNDWRISVLPKTWIRTSLLIQ